MYISAPDPETQCIYPKCAGGHWSVRSVQVTLGLGRAITSQPGGHTLSQDQRQLHFDLLLRPGA